MKSNYTLLIIPPDDGPTHQIRLSLHGKKIIIAGILCVVVLIISLFSYTTFLSHHLEAQKANLSQNQQMQEESLQSVSELKKDNEEKNQEIQRLKAESAKVSQDMAEIHELELKITSILKVEPKATQTNQGIVQQSYSAADSVDPTKVSTELSRLKQYYDMSLQYQSRIEHTPNILPLVGGVITSTFGYRRNPFGGFNGEFHDGVDFAVPYGTPVHATAAGIVTFAGWDSAYGEKVEINHGNDIITFYGHNSKLTVNEGDTVQKGEVIAYSGNTGRSTGAHLHYGALKYGESIDPLTFTNFTKEQ